MVPVIHDSKVLNASGRIPTKQRAIDSQVMPCITICSHAVDTIKPPMVFLVDHRNRLPLDSATASTALLALPMARPIRSGIEPRHAWRLYAVVVDVDEATGNADTIKARGYQSGYDEKPFRAVAASYVGG